MLKIGKLSLVPTSSNQIKQKTITNTGVSVSNLDHEFNQKEYE